MDLRKVLGLASAGVLLALLTSAVPALAQTVNVWVTTDNQKLKLRQQPSTAFSSGVGDKTNTIFVDETETYQSVEGFGASFTDSAAYLLNEKLTASARDAVMAKLFDRAVGIGISFVRNPMGASDLARSDYSYDDLPAGQTDPGLANFSIAHDQADIIPLVLQAKRINPQLKIMANPWSPPGWMKTSGSMIGGSLLPAMYEPFANYFVKYIQAYAAAGIPIDYVSLQNEPLYVPTDYPGMSVTPGEQLAVLKNFVLPALSASQLNTRVLVYDHNWDTPGYPETVFSDPVVASSTQVAGTAWHGYGGTPGAMSTVHNSFPSLGNYHTELSGGTWVADQMKFDFETITHAMRNWAKTFVKWSLALDQNRGPHTGGCGTCTPLVTVDSTTGVAAYDIDYYTLGHFSKFVAPGATRIYSNNAPNLVSVAFQNPDGSKVLVAFNDAAAAQRFQVAWGNASFTYKLKGFEGATFTWSGSQTGGYTVSAATQQIQASSYNDMSGLQTEPTTDVGGGYDLGFSSGGSWAVYKNIEFGPGVHSVKVRVASAGSGGTLEFHLHGVTGPLIGSAEIPITGGWQTWTTVSAPISGATGVADLFIVFSGGASIGNINWFRFK
ncbi:MAG TPA: carbohydrate-binding protein [Blastocatellia bacterium]|nr:carbohydrate-binding protein [Blastocatellia bacterium]